MVTEMSHQDAPETPVAAVLSQLLRGSLVTQRIRVAATHGG
jgi:hypothetical protein